MEIYPVPNRRYADTDHHYFLKIAVFADDQDNTYTVNTKLICWLVENIGPYESKLWETGMDMDPNDESCYVAFKNEEHLVAFKLVWGEYFVD